MTRSRRTPTGAVRLVLVRHGESYANRQERFQGQTDTGLTPRGHRQAERLARRLAAGFPEVREVVASDLGRVRDTAAPYLAGTGTKALPDPRLRELDTGSWSGRTFAEVGRDHPRELAAIAAGADVRRGGHGETFAELRRRVVRALAEHASRVAFEAPPGQRPTTIVFTHGGPIRVAVADALGLPPGGHHLLAPPANCAITVITRHLDEAAAAVGSGDLVSYNG